MKKPIIKYVTSAFPLELIDLQKQEIEEKQEIRLLMALQRRWGKIRSKFYEK
jgi:hypothetical protein